MTPRWLTEKAVRALHEQLLSLYGGASGIREVGALLSAMMRPQNRLHYEPDSSSVHRLAASYAYGIAMNHPFLDGNKRTAFQVMVVFLEKNGIEFIAPEADVVHQFLALASGELAEEKLAEWLELPPVTRPL